MPGSRAIVSLIYPRNRLHEILPNEIILGQHVFDRVRNLLKFDEVFAEHVGGCVISKISCELDVLTNGFDDITAHL